MTHEPPRSKSDYPAPQRAADAAYCRRILNRLIESSLNKASELEHHVQAKVTSAPRPAQSVTDLAAEFDRISKDACNAVLLARRLDNAEQVGDQEPRDRTVARDRFIRRLKSSLRTRNGDTVPKQAGGGEVATLPGSGERPLLPPANSDPPARPDGGGATILPFPTRPRDR